MDFLWQEKRNLLRFLRWTEEMEEMKAISSSRTGR